MKLLVFLRHILEKRRRKKIRPFVDLATDSIYQDSFNVRLDDPQKGKCYLKVGEKSVIGGNFVFETSGGFISIGQNVYIPAGTTLISRNEIIIDDDVIISWGCTIYDHNSHSIYWEERCDDIKNVYDALSDDKGLISNKDWSNVISAPIHICSKAWIGMNVIILKGVTIGEGAVVGAGSVVVRDVPSWSVVGGNPACVVKWIKENRVD